MNHRKNFVKLIEKVSEKTNNNSQIFNDFLKISATSLNTFNNNQTREKSFQETMQNYDEKIQPFFKNMLAELALTLNDCVEENPHYEDILGKIFHEMNLNERKNGQVFAPQHTGDLMGEIALPEDFVKSEIQRQESLVNAVGFISEYSRYAFENSLKIHEHFTKGSFKSE